MVLVTISGKAGPTTFDRKLAFAEFYDDSDGWRLDDWVVDEFVVHAWCDIEPYKG